MLRDRDRDRLREDRFSPRLSRSKIGKIRRRSRSLIEIAKIAISISIFDFPLRSNNAVVGCCVCKFRRYIAECRCIVCVIAAMCNIQCRTLCCVLPGTTALLSVLLFSWEVSVVKYAACLVCEDTWRQYSYYAVYRVCCMLSIVWVWVKQTVGMQSTAAHACTTHAPNLMEQYGNGKWNTTAICTTELHYGCSLLFTAATAVLLLYLDKTWYLVSCMLDITLVRLQKIYPTLNPSCLLYTSPSPRD